MVKQDNIHPKPHNEHQEGKNSSNRSSLSNSLKNIARNTIIATWMALLPAVACKPTDDIWPDINISKEILSSWYTIYKPTVLKNDGTKVRIWNNILAECSDPSWIKSLTVTINGQTISKWMSITIDESCSLTINSKDTYDNPSNQTIKINYIDNTTPKFTTHEVQAPIFQWEKIIQSGKDVFAWSKKIFAWDNDNYTATFKLDNQTTQLPITIQKCGDHSLECTLTYTKNWKHISATSTIQVKEVNNNQAPTIERKYSPDEIPNICWWVVATTENNQLKFWDVVVYQWKDDNTPICTPSFEIDGKTFQSWATINLPDWDYTWKFSLTDQEWEPNNVEFPIKSQSIDLSYLDNNMRVDQEIDLIKNIPSGINVTKVEIEINGQKQEISQSNWHNYKPALSWECKIYVTWSGEFGNSGIKETSLTIKWPEFEAPQLDKINIFETTFPRYKNLNQAAKNYVKPLLEVAYYASSRCRDPNTISIMLGEYAQGTVNIWSMNDSPVNEHAEQWKFHINVRCPNLEIKSCMEIEENWWDMICLENYINQHPNQSFIISCASDPAVWTDRNEWYNSKTVKSLGRILNNPRVMMIWADKDKSKWRDKRMLDNEIIKTGSNFKSVSLNGNQDNHFMAIWEFPWKENNYFCPQYDEWLKCCMPQWFDGEWCTTPLFMYWVVNRDYTQYTQTDGSMSTASAAGMLRAASETIRSNRRNKNDNSTITQAEAARIIKRNYLKTEKSKYKDPNTNQLVEWPSCSRIDGQKIKDNEIIGLDQLEKIQLKASTDDTPLPNRKWIYYEGMWIYFKVGWQKYPNIKAHQSILEQAIKSWTIEEWGWSWTLFKDQWWEENYVDIKTCSIDNNAKIFIECDSPIRKIIDLSEAYNTSSINYTKPDIHLAQVADIDRNMIADIPRRINPWDTIILWNHIKPDWRLQPYCEVYIKWKWRIPYKDVSDYQDLSEKHIRLNSYLALRDHHIRWRFSLLNDKWEIIKTQEVNSHIAYSDTPFAQTSPNTTPRNKSDEIRSALLRKQRPNNKTPYIETHRKSYMARNNTYKG